MQEWYILGVGKVSFLERCPQFRGVLIEGFHGIVCIYTNTENETHSLSHLCVSIYTIAHSTEYWTLVRYIQY